MLLSMTTDASALEEFTVDELAARARMTVRNVRAYASRGLIDPPRLAGRTGYYNREHLQRLQLIRQLLERGYTLSAVEKAVSNAPHKAAGHTLDLMAILSLEDEVQSEIMDRESLAALAGVERDDALIEAMVGLGLVEKIDDNNLKLVDPAVVRAGASAVSFGLSPETVLGLFPLLKEHLGAIADAYVSEVAREQISPFVEAGLPEDQWQRIIDLANGLIPIASQVTLGIFRAELRNSIDAELAEQIKNLAGSGSN
jgi:DNA-binding transcriptional MerR regulator